MKKNLNLNCHQEGEFFYSRCRPIKRLTLQGKKLVLRKIQNKMKLPFFYFQFLLISNDNVIFYDTKNGDLSIVAIRNKVTAQFIQFFIFII
jgi:hypothetical protein